MRKYDMKWNSVKFGSESFDDDDSGEITYDEESRLVQLIGSIDDETAKGAMYALRLLESNGVKPIRFEIYSYGGSLFSGMIIHDVMKEVRSPVYTLGYGLCASMAAMLLAAGEPGHRYVSPSARVMIHAPSAYTEVEFDMAKMEQFRENLIRDYNLGIKMLSVYCHKSEAQVKEDLKKNLWMDAGQAVKYGLADKILEHKGGMYAKSLSKPKIVSKPKRKSNRK
ncbi:MAG: ATP-dependent Clp protease proteolytic subunit [Nanoarchaeota archaeon]